MCRGLTYHASGDDVRQQPAAFFLSLLHKDAQNTVTADITGADDVPMLEDDYGEPVVPEDFADAADIRGHLSTSWYIPCATRASHQ